jgi:four helix bundle protein
LGGDVNRNWKDLIVWQSSHELVPEIYRLIHDYPADEKYALCDQMKRAAYSIPSNIVEGHAKQSRSEFKRYLYISRGSLEELRYFLLLSNELDYIGQSIYDDLESRCRKLSYQLNNFINSL